MERKQMRLCRALGRHMKSVVALACLAVLGACAGPSGVTSFTAADCKQISKRAEAKINWARVPQVEIRARNGEYSPMVLRLWQGRPYTLRIRNRDDEVRVFRARDFFEKNAVLAVAVEGQRQPETCIASISIPARQTAEVRMVAITDGTYEYEDNLLLIPLVMSAGASGAIVVEERRETAGVN